MSAEDQTNRRSPEFDFSAYPGDTCFHDRRSGKDRREPAPAATSPPAERRRKKERRRRIDPTTFEKQYTPDEIEFMNAMQRFKVQSGKAFPSYGDVLHVAHALGYRRPGLDENASPDEPPAILPVPER
jgi:hypothetical protein